jgi:transcriptional regulator with XRE-family HTH domain
MADLIPQRFREAREYLGVTRDQVAAALHCSPLLIEGLEDGGVEPSAAFLVQLSRLYHRPAEWFTGEFTFSPSPGLLGKVENLTTRDRDAVLDFAEFLQCSAALKAREVPADG